MIHAWMFYRPVDSILVQTALKSSDPMEAFGRGVQWCTAAAGIARQQDDAEVRRSWEQAAGLLGLCAQSYLNGRIEGRGHRA